MHPREARDHCEAFSPEESSSSPDPFNSIFRPLLSSNIEKVSRSAKIKKIRFPRLYYIFGYTMFRVIKPSGAAFYSPSKIKTEFQRQHLRLIQVWNGRCLARYISPITHTLHRCVLPLRCISGSRQTFPPSHIIYNKRHPLMILGRAKWIGTSDHARESL